MINCYVLYGHSMLTDERELVITEPCSGCLLYSIIITILTDRQSPLLQSKQPDWYAVSRKLALFTTYICLYILCIVTDNHHLTVYNNNNNNNIMFRNKE